MSKKGPRRKPTLKPKVSVVAVASLLNDPQPHDESLTPILEALKKVADIHHLAKAFIDLSSSHITPKRQADAAAYFTQNQKIISESFDSLIREIDRIYEETPCSYSLLDAEIIELVKIETELLKDPTPENQRALKQVIGHKVIKAKAFFSQLLQGCERINCWYTLLKHAQLSKHESTRLLLAKTFSELNQNLCYLETLFIHGNVPTEHNYFVYQLLFEKYTWLFELLDTFQAELIKDLFSKADGTDATLSTIQNSIVFHSAFLNKEIAQQQCAKTQQLCDTLTQHSPQSEESLSIIAKFKSFFPNIRDLNDKINLHPWLPTFKAIDTYLQNRTISTATNIDITDTISKAKRLYASIITLNKSNSCPPELLQSWIDEFIETLNEVRTAPVEQSTAVDPKLLYRIGLALHQLTKQDFRFSQGFVVLCIQAALLKLTDELKQACIQSMSVVPIEPVVVAPEPVVVAPEPVVVQTTKPFLEPVTEHFAKLTLDDANAEKALTQEWAKRGAQMESALKQTHEKAITKKIAEQQQVQAQRIEELRAQHEMAREELKQKLAKQEADALKAQADKMQTEIATKEATLAQNQQRFINKTSIKLQRKQQALQDAHTSQMTALETEYAAQLALLQSQHQDNLKALEQTKVHHYNALQIKTSQQTELLEKERATQQVEYLAKAEKMRRATDGYSAIHTIDVPIEIAYIMQDLADAGIEAYLVGGFVRDNLLNLPRASKADFDIIVNAHPSELPIKLKRFAKNNTFMPCQLKMGNIDFWCEPWNDLSSHLKKRDFKINTFICTINGEVFDLLGFAPELASPYLHLIDDNTQQRFAKDRSLMLRMLRLSTQVGKQISAADFNVFYQDTSELTAMPFGIYLKNIEHLFIGRDATQHYHNLMAANVLPFIFPGLLLPEQSPILATFISYKLKHFAQGNNHGYYHVLALFSLDALLRSSPANDTELRIHLKSNLKQFFKSYKGQIAKVEKNKTYHSVLALLLNAQTQQNECIPGLYAEFLQYSHYAEQQRMMALPPIVPAYQNYQAQIPIRALHNTAPTGSFKP